LSQFDFDNEFPENSEMPSLLEALESLFGTANLYEVLQITKEATPAQIRKAYHKV